LENAFLCLLLAVGFLAAWVMAMMVMNTVKQTGGRHDVWSPFGVVDRSYNRKYRGVFILCIAIEIVLAIVFNLLFFTGHML
jgi:hypothetical protein